MSKKEVVWVQFAAAGMSQAQEDPPEHIAARADAMLLHWEARFGDMAFLLEGQHECAACRQPLPPGSTFTPSQDGVKFCNGVCLKASGREE